MVHRRDRHHPKHHRHPRIAGARAAARERVLGAAGRRGDHSPDQQQHRSEHDQELRPAVGNRAVQASAGSARCSVGGFHLLSVSIWDSWRVLPLGFAGASLTAFAGGWGGDELLGQQLGAFELELAVSGEALAQPGGEGGESERGQRRRGGCRLRRRRTRGRGRRGTTARRCPSRRCGRSSPRPPPAPGSGQLARLSTRTRPPAGFPASGSAGGRGSSRTGTRRRRAASRGYTRGCSSGRARPAGRSSGEARWIRSSSDRSGLTSANCLSVDVDDRLLVGHGDLVERDRVAVASGSRPAGPGSGRWRSGGCASGRWRLRRGGGAARCPTRARAGRGRGAARAPVRSPATRVLREIAGGSRVCATSIPRRVSEYSSGGLPSLRACSRMPTGCWAISPCRCSLVSRSMTRCGRAARQHRPSDQRPRHESGAVQEREDRVVLVVQARQVLRAGMLVGGADSLIRSRYASSRRLSGAGVSCSPGGRPGTRRPTTRRTGLSSSFGGGGGGS